MEIVRLSHSVTKIAGCTPNTIFFFTKFSFWKPPSDSEVAVPMPLFIVKTWIFSSFIMRWNTWTSFNNLPPASSFLMHFMQGHELSLVLHFKTKWFISFLWHLKEGLFKYLLYKLWLPSKALKPRRGWRFKPCVSSGLGSFPMRWLCWDSLGQNTGSHRRLSGDLTQNEECKLITSTCGWDWGTNNSKSTWTWPLCVIEPTFNSSSKLFHDRNLHQNPWTCICKSRHQVEVSVLVDTLFVHQWFKYWYFPEEEGARELPHPELLLHISVKSYKRLQWNGIHLHLVRILQRLSVRFPVLADFLPLKLNLALVLPGHFFIQPIPHSWKRQFIFIRILILWKSELWTQTENACSQALPPILPPYKQKAGSLSLL